MQRVLITGCSSGFGYVTAIESMRSGYITIATFRDLSRDGQLRAAVAGLPGVLRVERLDVLSADSIAALAHRVGPIDALVNNAGVCLSGSFFDTADEELELLMDTNFYGPVRLIKAFVPGMLRNGGGKIVNISSIAGRVGLPALSGYAASKHALNGFSEAILLELRQQGIYVSLVEPGLFATAMLGANRFETRRALATDSPFSAMYVGYRDWLVQMVAARAGDPRRVARRVIRILRARRPRLRYRVGWDAWALGALDRSGGLPLMLELLRQTVASRVKHEQK